MTAVLSIGSNLGNRLAHLRRAVELLAPVARSSVWETAPVGGPEQDDYLNAVLLADTTLPAARLMERALAVEDAFERERSDVQNAPRTLDVDLIVVGDRRSNEDFLRLPHPRAHERAFVLQPWHDLEPDAVFPERGPIADLLEATGSAGVRRREDLSLEVE